MKKDGWQQMTARKRGFGVEVQFLDVNSGICFWSRKATYTKKKEAIDDMEARNALGITCQVVNFDGVVIHNSKKENK